ncbi:hypothetical protein O181_070141 [Austropuccinia psidii MF-1]|uniref:Bifunctional lycopene cyclase/phytoene synthase n=1 Tax=Austropuccinia psidii MF-1 TaxID=1389203 RepID=A0A9Q3I5E8_9BASI|nr:hypothetical protein [Austropuccinia psidii MF-1]
MLLTYRFFHLIFTLPPTILFHFILKPMWSSRDSFRILFLSVIATSYSLPWDSYIISNKAWGYPSWSVLFTVFKVPIEEIFFFIIQTVITTYIYTLLTIPIIPALYIQSKPNNLEFNSPNLWKLIRWGPSIGFCFLTILSWCSCQPATKLFYLTCIGFWASPVCAGLWAIAGDHILQRPRSISLSILIPTLYFSFCDTVAIRHGTWFISNHTSTGIFVTPHLPIEELIFFFITNLLIVFGLAGIEKFDAIIDTWPELFSPKNPFQSPSHHPHARTHFLDQFHALMFAVRKGLNLSNTLKHTTPAISQRIFHLGRTLEILSVASKSFYAASFIFPNFSGIRSKFVILYGFCRETDDLIDCASDKEEARRIVQVCKEFLQLLWPSSSNLITQKSITNTFQSNNQDLEFQLKLEDFVNTNLPQKSRPTFLIFATLRHVLRREPFDELVRGYEYDSIEFPNKEIVSDQDLIQYSRWVAGSVGEMCVSIMWWVYGAPQDENQRESILCAANEMGCALQFINIARDIKEDAKIGRVYIPRLWFEGQLDGLGLNDLEKLKKCQDLDQFPYEIVAEKLLKLANDYQTRSQAAIERLPPAFRPGIRAATKVYLEIGDQIRAKFTSSSFLQTPKTTCLSNSIINKPPKIQESILEKSIKRWNGDRVFLTRFQRFQIVVKELWGFR